MKHILLLSICFFLNFSASAQDFTFSPEEPEASANLDDLSTNPGDVAAHAEIVNNTALTLNFIWERTIIDAPTGWKFGVCDLNSCYLTHIETKDFELGPNATSLMDVHAYPAGNPGVLEGAVPGIGVVELKVYRENFEADAITRTYTIEISETTTTISLVKEALNLYPNPTTDYFRLANDQEIAKIQVYNIVGKKMLEFSTKQETYDISSLRDGLYLVRMFSADNKVVRTTRLTKRNP